MLMPDFESLLQSIAKRPAMYVGKCSIESVSNYLQGYDHALSDAGQAETPLSGWLRWVEWRFLISHSAWHWTRILLHVYGSEQAAIEALPQLHREFLAQRAELGIDEIESQLRRRLIAEYGRDWHEPPTTETACPK
jgi:hypothetical protein